MPPTELGMTEDIKRTLLVMGSTTALIVVGVATYFVIAYPNLISVLTFFGIAPVFLILGFGFLKIARKSG
jgi:hypothetical protein